MTPRLKPAPPIDLSSFAAEHLSYEAHMLVGALGIQPHDQFEMNVKVEVFVLHLRNLIEFFYPSNPRPDDVLAEHYVTDWVAKRPAMTPLLQTARFRAGKEMNHLTAQRIAGAPDHKKWDFDALAQEMRRVVSVFISLHPDMPTNAIDALRDI